MRFLTLLLSLAVLRVPVAQANVDYVPFPSKDELRSLQLQAYACSRENDAELCDATRKTADPLMDHPRLPAACKDAVWELIQASTPATPNSFQRRDSIDNGLIKSICCSFIPRGCINESFASTSCNAP